MYSSRPPLNHNKNLIVLHPQLHTKISLWSFYNSKTIYKPPDQNPVLKVCTAAGSDSLHQKSLIKQ